MAKRLSRLALLLVLLGTFATLAGSEGAAAAATPPNPQDPCAQNGRDTCGTTGVGSYQNYAYGLRWFGDYRNAIPGVSGPTFCIDLGYWFPGRSYDYKQHTAAGLRSRAGTAISATTLSQISYAIWNSGRSNNATQQAAVMLYVHGQIGDAPAAETAGDSIGSSVYAVYKKVAAAATKYAGPYTLSITMPKQPVAGQSAKATIKLVSASGNGVPGVNLNLDVSGAANAPTTATTGSGGVATVALTPDGSGNGLSLKATASDLAANAPTLYVPTSGASAANAQRLIAPASQDVTAAQTAKVSRTTPTVTSQASPADVNVGGSDADQVTFGGLPSTVSPQATVNLYGPAPSQSAISCTGAPVQSVKVGASDTTVTAPSVTPAGVGWYGYQVVLPATEATNAVTSACAPAKESFEVTTTPAVQTQVSAASSAPGTSLSDTLTVSGLDGQSATVTADLYGPFASTSTLKCTGTPVWSGTIAVNTDGTYATTATTLSTPGYYVYEESIAAQGLVQAASTSCTDTAETTIATGTPAITTKVSNAVVTPGATLQDHAVISGLGVLPAQVHVVLWGPYSTSAAANCTGPQAWSGDLTANGDGTYVTKPATVKQAGYYVYQESIAATNGYPSVTTGCADTAETSLAKPKPALGTQASASVVVPGSSISDQIKLSGVGATPVNIGVKLYGPFPTLSQLSCGGTPYWTGTVHASGDGTINSPSAVIKQAGFYVYRETLEGNGLMPTVTTPCASLAETVLGRPLIITGPGAAKFAADTDPLAIPATDEPTQITISALGINASVDKDAISVKTGQMEIPGDIHRVGWWQDGAAPGGTTGTTLLFGHIDWTGEGPGAFYDLAMAGDGKQSVKGDLVQLQTTGGKKYSYRITSVSRMPKDHLPTSIFTKSGPRRLVMVTCGGAYDAKTHHYADNVVVTAVPA